MSAMSRRKGQVAERELTALLSDALGFVVKRKSVNRKDDADCVDIDGWAVECKRCEKTQLNAWWEQAERQAKAINRKPILFFRASRQPWVAMLDLSEISSNFPYGRFQVCIPFEAACQIIRESLKCSTENG